MLRIYVHDHLALYQSFALSVKHAKEHEYLNQEHVTCSWLAGARVPFTMPNLAAIFAEVSYVEWTDYLTDVTTR
jgi:hypothetical protein